MKFLISLILTALVSFVACLFLPWWTVAVVAFVIALVFAQKPLPSFLSGFTAIFLLWLGLVLWISAANGHVFAHKISLLIIKTDNPPVLMLVTALIGALVAGAGALTGSFAAKR